MAPVVSTVAPQQHKQTSRKGKRAWRKNVDISEVQDGLENVRDQIIRTGGIISDKPSSALFAIDTAGSDDIRKKIPKAVKQLRADQIIGQRSAVPSVDTRKRSGITGIAGIAETLLEPASKRRKANRINHKELERLRERAYGGDSVRKDIVSSEATAATDPWTEVKAIDDTRFTFLPKGKPKVAPKTLKEAPVSLLENGKAMPAVVKPNPAASYNPQFDDYEKLINEEGAREVIAEQKRIQEAKEDAEKQALIEAAENEAEKSEYYTEDESVWEGIESDYEGVEKADQKRPRRKTPAERNRTKRRKVAEQEAKHKARTEERGQRNIKPATAMAPEASTITLVPVKEDPTDEELGVAAATPGQVRDSSDDEIDDRKLRRRKFGTIAVPEKPLELVLADELQDSLRLLRPEGNLLKDRFRNYLVAGKVETRRPGFQAKKARRKATEKWTHKDFVVPT